MLDFHNLLLSHNNLLQSSKAQARPVELDSWAAFQRTSQQYSEKTSPFPVRKKYVTKFQYTKTFLASRKGWEERNETKYVSKN